MGFWEILFRKKALMGFLEEAFSGEIFFFFYEANFNDLNDLEHSLKNTLENRFY